MIENKNIDGGKGFDWGRTSLDYAKYRDIYPEEVYRYLLEHNICTKGQRVLDIGTGTGVFPRNLYRYGAQFTGADISANQIEQAKRLAEDNSMNIKFLCSPAEDLDFDDGSFDIITACQCFTYFNHEVLAPKSRSFLDKDGRLVLLYMAWLPYEDAVAGKSEELVLKYNPVWTGCGETRHAIAVPDVYLKYFSVESSEVFDVEVLFTRDTWNGRIKACRGIGASLPEDEVRRFEEEHKALLKALAPEQFKVLHYVAVTILKKNG